MSYLRKDTIQLLTQEDVDTLKNDPSPEARAKIATKISSQYLQNKYQENQLKVAEDICRMLMVDSDAIVREALSDNLKDSSTLPKDIAITLANDKSDSVAMPMLTSSPAIPDKDLVEIIKNTENTTRHIAISKRENVSSDVSGALVETNNTNVVSSLLANKGAVVSEETFESVVNSYASNSEISRQIADRSSNNFIHTEEKGIEVTISNLIKKNKLTPSVIIEVLCLGNSSFFEMSLSKTLGLDILVIQDILRKKGKDGFNILYTKASLPELMREASFLAYSVIKEMEGNGEKQANKTLKNYLTVLHRHITEALQKNKIESAAYILAIIEKKIDSENANTNNAW